MTSGGTSRTAWALKARDILWLEIVEEGERRRARASGRLEERCSAGVWPPKRVQLRVTR